MYKLRTKTCKGCKKKFTGHYHKGRVYCSVRCFQKSMRNNEARRLTMRLKKNGISYHVVAKIINDKLGLKLRGGNIYRMYWDEVKTRLAELESNKS